MQLISRHLEIRKTLPELDVSLKKRKIGEPDINPVGASSLTADTPRRREFFGGVQCGCQQISL